MSDAIAFLEHLAREPYLDDDAFEALAASLAPVARGAVRQGDARALATALGRPAEMACFIATPDRDQPDREDAPGDDQPQPDDIPGDQIS